jgi:LDH2 family malate/lactate/ureidoglycolate dehydrogenase
MRELRAAHKEPGQTRIYTAGEKEFENERRIRVEGVPIIPNLQKDIRALVKDLVLTQYHFSFL